MNSEEFEKALSEAVTNALEEKKANIEAFQKESDKRIQAARERVVASIAELGRSDKVALCNLDLTDEEREKLTSEIEKCLPLIAHFNSEDELEMTLE